MSVKTAVTSRRSSVRVSTGGGAGAVAVAVAIGDPHAKQNLATSGFSWPQLMQKGISPSVGSVWAFDESVRRGGVAHRQLDRLERPLELGVLVEHRYREADPRRAVRDRRRSDRDAENAGRLEPAG